MSRFEIEGEKELVAQLKSLKLVPRFAAIEVISATALGIAADAKRDAPTDTGRTRSSIQSAFYAGGLSAEVFVGAESGLYVDRGTGIFNLDGPRAPYFPPSSALTGWARRHGLQGMEWIIARSIFFRGGIKPRPFFTPAVEAWTPKYVAGLEAAVSKRFP